jgi:hypothetical protein
VAILRQLQAAHRAIFELRGSNIEQGIIGEICFTVSWSGDAVPILVPILLHAITVHNLVFLRHSKASRVTRGSDVDAD